VSAGGPLRVQRLDARAVLPSRGHDGDAGLDLCALDGGTLQPGERTAVATGVAIALESGQAGLVLPRSGNALNHGIALVNSPGLIDAGYRGELKVLLLNTGSEPFTAAAGERIAQLVVTAVALPDVVEVAALEESDRGAGGFGSSGR
jgi:dUTP pyrophosphatase